MADPATGRRLRADALFRVESLSKPVTAWGAMRLAETGRLDLDAPADAYLTRWRPPPGTPPVTLRQLLSHTAGLGIGDFAARFAPGAARPSLAGQLEAEFATIAPPGARFAYSDTGYNLLELAIEDTADADFAALMRREVLAPLGMARATFDWPGAPMPVGHDLAGRPVAPYVYPGRASGGLHATAADIARFAVAGMDGATQPVLSHQAVAALHRPVTAVGGLFGAVADGYALGHFTETLSDGRRAVWHGGIVILSNSQRAWPLFARVLRAWSGDLGASPVGMSRVLWAGIAARVIIVLLLALAALAVLARARGGRPGALRRGAAGALAAALIGGVLWAARQDYLFLFSILPGLAAYLGAAMLVAGAGLLVYALWRPGGG
jgi:CubicO group peptidase (beta-lactamase class C family)